MAFSRRLPDCHALSIPDIKRGPRVPCPNKNRPGKILSAQTVGYQHHTGHVVISTYPSAPHDLFTCISTVIIAVDRNICQAVNSNSFHSIYVPDASACSRHFKSGGHRRWWWVASPSSCAIYQIILYFHLPSVHSLRQRSRKIHMTR
jgi:hypothetical protein